MIYDFSEINRLAINDPAELIRRGEEQYTREIRRAAEAIAENLVRSPIVLLAGPSAAGKTTSAKRVGDELLKRGIRTHVVSMDNYFGTLDLASCPKTADGKADFESPELIDMELLSEHFDTLEAGGEIKVPYFLFSEQRRSPDRFTPLRLQKNEAAIFEGIHALNDRITERRPGAFTVFLDAAAETVFPDGERMKPQWTRLIRRTVRDNSFRGADAGYTMELWKNVRVGEVKYIAPFTGKAKLRLDTSLLYDLPVLASHVLPLLCTVNEGMEGYEEVRSIIRLLERYAEVDSALVPVDSLIREFIGGGKYEY